MIVITISCFNCKSAKIQSAQIPENGNEKKDSILINHNIKMDTFSIICYDRMINIDKKNYENSKIDYMNATNCITEIAFKGDSNAITAIINHVNSKNYKSFKQFSYPFRGKRLFEHILYNIASEIYCGNPYIDADWISIQALSPGLEELIEMTKGLPDESVLVELFTQKVINERNEKYKHLFTYNPKGDEREACRYVSKVVREYWAIKVAYEAGLLKLKDFGEQ